MKLSLPRGMRDIPPEEYEKFEAIRAAVLESFKEFSFKVMEPSAIENLETLIAKSGPSIVEEIYTFKDKAGRDLGLRFDLTVGLTRYVIMNPGLPKPVKLGAFSYMWRYDEPQFARYRMFTQWDAEIFGSRSPYADAEVIALTSAVYRKLKLPVEIKISSRRLAESIIKSVAPKADPLAVLRLIDKIPRIGFESVKERMKDIIGQEKVETVLLAFDFEGGVGNLSAHLARAGVQEAELHVDELAKVIDYAFALGAENLSVDLKIVRGLDYYDGVVFEVAVPGAPKVGSIAGGGRFDTLPAAFGAPDLGAVGVAGGVERTVLALEAINPFPSERVRRGVFVCVVSEDSRKDAYLLAKRLRGAGIETSVEVGSRTLKRQLEYADKLGYKVAAFVGPRETAAQKVRLKILDTGEEFEAPVEEVTDVILSLHEESR